MSDVVPLEAVSAEDQAHLETFKTQFAKLMDDYKVEFSVGIDEDNNFRVLIGVPSLDGKILATTDLIDPVPFVELISSPV